MVKIANITLGQIIHTDLNEPLDVTNKALHVTQVGRNVELCNVNTNITVPSGTFLNILEGIDVTNYENVKASVNVSEEASTSYDLQFNFENPDRTGINVYLSSKIFTQIGNDEQKTWTSRLRRIRIYNGDAVDRTVISAQVLGVR